MNVKGLREVGRFIVEHPENFTMWMRGESRDVGVWGCFAVWACWLVGVECRVWQSYEREARRILDLSTREGEELFYPCEWPDSYRQRHASAKDREEQAKIANEVIEYVIRERKGKR